MCRAKSENISKTLHCLVGTILQLHHAKCKHLRQGNHQISRQYGQWFKTRDLASVFQNIIHYISEGTKVTDMDLMHINYEQRRKLKLWWETMVVGRLNYSNNKLVIQNHPKEHYTVQTLLIWILLLGHLNSPMTDITFDSIVVQQLVCFLRFIPLTSYLTKFA